MEFFQTSSNPIRIYLLILYRYAVIILCFAIDFFLQYENQIHTLNISIFLTIFVLNTFFLFLTPYIKKYDIFIIFQIITDLLSETIIIFVTGGILSAFVSLYFVSILVSGLLVSLRISIFCASFATVGISTIVTIYYYSILNKIPLPCINIFPFISFPQENDLHFCRAYLFAQAVSFYAVAFFSGYLTDIRRKENILHKEILDHLVDGVLLIDYKNRVTYVNLEAKKMLNIHSTKNCNGYSIVRLLSDDSHIDLLKGILMQRSLEYESHWYINGQKIAINITITPINIRKKRLAYILILKNISFQKRMEEAIAIANRLSSINETAKMIAHEIRNPLASILGASQELSRKSEDNEASILFDIMIKESQRIDKIVQDFLEMSKLRKPLLQTTSISKVLKETIIFLQQQTHFKIKTEIEPNLFVNADSGHLKQLFYNLGINSLEASKDEDPNIFVSVEKSTAEKVNSNEMICGVEYPNNYEGVEICFSDSGKGIKAELLQKIFQPFFTTKKGGSGIGLAIVQQILESHQATYYIDSDLKNGTKFFIFFPMKK